MRSKTCSGTVIPLSPSTLSCQGLTKQFSLLELLLKNTCNLGILLSLIIFFLDLLWALLVQDFLLFRSLKNKTVSKDKVKHMANFCYCRWSPQTRRRPLYSQPVLFHKSYLAEAQIAHPHRTRCCVSLSRLRNVMLLTSHCWQQGTAP